MRPSKPISSQFRFSLASVLLAMMVISICLAILRLQLVIGLLISFLTVLALIRTVLIAICEDRQGTPLSVVGKVVEFLFSWALMLPFGVVTLVVGVISLTFVALIGFVVTGFPYAYWPPLVMNILVIFFFVACITAAIAAGGAVLAICIRASLAYLPVARVFDKA